MKDQCEDKVANKLDDVESKLTRILTLSGNLLSGVSDINDKLNGIGVPTCAEDCNNKDPEAPDGFFENVNVLMTTIIDHLEHTKDTVNSILEYNRVKSNEN